MMSIASSRKHNNNMSNEQPSVLIINSPPSHRYRAIILTVTRGRRAGMTL